MLQAWHTRVHEAGGSLRSPPAAAPPAARTARFPRAPPTLSAPAPPPAAVVSGPRAQWRAFSGELCGWIGRQWHASLPSVMFSFHPMGRSEPTSAERQPKKQTGRHHQRQRCTWKSRSTTGRSASAVSPLTSAPCALQASRSGPWHASWIRFFMSELAGEGKDRRGEEKVGAV